MLLNNTLFDVDTLLTELQKGFKGEKSALEILQKKLRANYFGKDISNEQALNEINNPGFNDFPRLKYVLQQVFSGQEHIAIPEYLKDCEPTVTFEQLNNQYGYFKNDKEKCASLFIKLAIACKKMTSLIERQAHDDEMAYKLMALFYDPNMSIEKNFEQISKKFDELITTKQDKTIATPYHDAFVTILHHFPKFEDVLGLENWKAFIMKEGFKSLDIFASCATQNSAFENIKEANTFLLAQTYPRAQENPTLVKLCKGLLISNPGFEAGLRFVQSGWPKKESDNLPLVDVQDSTGKYFWVKLPTQDMRALYLGNLIPGCCQHIGGHSEQCVKDGIALSDNGFYVLLKSKRAQANSNRIVDNQINDKDYDIVAQSYAWKTSNGNLCLDSIEWNKDRVTTDIIQDLMTKFSEKVFEEHPDIKHINVGKGGQTPTAIYPNCPINETMKQGCLYMDARQQYQIASNISKDALNSITERLKDLPRECQDTILYLAPYFENIENVPGQLMGVIDELPKNLSKIKLPPSLSTNDFKKITYEDYQQMNEAEKSSISTVCKIFNSQNEEELKQWLPIIPDEELSYISLMKQNYSLAFKMAVFQRLPRTHQLSILHEWDASESSLLTQSQGLIDFFKIILALYPSDEARIKALREKDIDGTSPLINVFAHPDCLELNLSLYPSNEARIKALQEKDIDGISPLMMATSHPDALKLILPLYTTGEARITALQEKDKDGKSALMRAVSNPESLKIILDLFPENQRSIIARSLAWSASSNLESLKMLLSLIPKYELFGAIIQKDNKGCSLLYYIDPQKTDFFNLIIELLPKNKRLSFIRYVLKIHTNNYELIKTLIDKLQKEEQFEAIKEIKLGDLCSNSEHLKNVLALYPTNDARIDALYQKNGFGHTDLLNDALSYPESLKIILELYPTKEDLYNAILRNNYIDFPLMNAISNIESFKIMLSSIPMEKRLSAIIQKNIYGDSILMLASRDFELLKMVLELLPENERLKAINEKDNYGDSILRLASKDFKLLKMVFELLPENERLKAIIQKNKNGDSILSLVLRDFELLKRVLELPPENERLGAITYEYLFRGSILTNASKSIQDLELILKLLPENDRLAAMKVKDKDGYTLLHKCTLNPDLIKITLGLFPEEQRLMLLKEIDSLGYSILHNSISDAALFKSIMNIFSEERRVEILMEKNIFGASMLYKAISNPETQKIVLETFPEEIGWVIEDCLKHLALTNLEKPMLTMITFIVDMKKFYSADLIKEFVHALIYNENIESALNGLLPNSPSNFLFKAHSKESLQDQFKKLDEYWSSRIPDIEPTDLSGKKCSIKK